MLAGAQKTMTDKLQRILIAAARVLSGTQKFDRGLSAVRPSGSTFLSGSFTSLMS